MTISKTSRAKVVEAIQIEGAPLHLLATRSGVHIKDVSKIVSALVANNQAFDLMVGTGEDGRRERWVFETATARELWHESWLDEVARRRRARQEAEQERRKEERRLNTAEAQRIRENRARSERKRRAAAAKKSACEGLPATECPLGPTECDEEPQEAPPPSFSSLRPGQYIAPAPAWLQGVAA